MNCAGFIKIDTSRVAERTDAYIELLDGSRVHPETYEWVFVFTIIVDVTEIFSVYQVGQKNGCRCP